MGRSFLAPALSWDIIFTSNENKFGIQRVCVTKVELFFLYNNLWRQDLNVLHVNLIFFPYVGDLFVNEYWQ